MATLRDRRRDRQLAELRDHFGAFEREVRRLDRAMGARPSARDDAELAAIAGALPGIGERMEEAARRLARSALDREDDAFLRRARKNARLASDIAEVIARVRAHRATPLLIRTAGGTPGAAREEVLATAFLSLELSVNGETQSETMRGYGFPFVPHHPGRFVESMQAAFRVLSALGRLEGARFLDVGAGAGTKLLLAQEFFAEAHGIELDEGYLARAALIGNAGGPVRRVFAGDALAYEGYGEFEVIYAWVPPSLSEIQNALERRIWEGAREGTVVVAPYLRASFLHGLPSVAPQIFVKGYEGAALEELRREAELTGPLVPPPVRWRKARNWANPAFKAFEILAKAGFAG
jgi:hypothetical protein